MEPLLLTPKEAARALGLSPSYVYELLASETLPSITIGRTRRIPRRALEEFVAACEASQGGYTPHPDSRHRADARTSCQQVSRLVGRSTT